MSSRDQAIANITEKLRELAGVENALHANLMRSTATVGDMPWQTYYNRREAAALHYATADLYELLIEAITAIPLFDDLEAQFSRGEQMTNRDVDPEHVAECDAAADAYADTPMYDGSES